MLVGTNEIIAAYSAVQTGTPLGGVYRQEITQTMGPREDSNIVPSIFNDPLGEPNFTFIDTLVGKFL